MHVTHNTKQVDFSELSSLLEEIFGIDKRIEYDSMHSGYMSQNFRVRTNNGSFFLKRYRDRMNSIVHEIKRAEEYFFQNGLPIILPIKDRYGRESFWCHGSWYSLFPFVESASLTRTDLTDPLTISIATTLAKIHEAGERFSYRPFQMMRVGNKRKFLMENVELDRQINSRSHLTQNDEQIKELLSLKRRLFETNTAALSDFHLTFDCLLHGDYQHYNLFAKNNTVTHIFDLERAALGPSVYEMTRAIILDCFEDGWTEKNFAHARLYLNAYRERRTISFESFAKSIQFYLYNIVHTSWIEANYVVYGIQLSLDILTRQKNRLLYLSQHNLIEFASRIWGN